MLIKPLAMAAAAGLLMTSAAYAGDKADHMDKTAAASATHDMSATSPMTVNPAWSTSEPAASATTYSSDVAVTIPMSVGDALMAGGTVEVISNAPVADTPENRALYRPLSATGRRTAAAGN